MSPLDHHLGDARQIVTEAYQRGGVSSTRELFDDPIQERQRSHLARRYAAHVAVPRLLVRVTRHCPPLVALTVELLHLSAATSIAADNVQRQIGPNESAVSPQKTVP
jgi:hypothetical protein